MADLDYSFAPQPHALVADQNISHGACRLWGAIHMLKWNRIDPDPGILTETLGVGERSVFRWLAELEQAGWLKWNKFHIDPTKRLMLRTSTDAAEAERLNQIRSLFATGTPTIEQIRELLTETESLIDPPDGGDSGGSGAIYGSTAMGGSGDSGGSGAIHGRVGDPVGTDSATGIRVGDPVGTDSATGIRVGDPVGTDSATGIIPASNSPLADASDRGRRDHGGGGGKSSLIKRFQHHHQEQRPGDKNGSAYTPTDAERWMIEKLASSTKAAQWRHLPIEVVQAEYTRRSQAGQGWGAIFDAWEIVAPQLPSAAAPADAAALSVTEATRRVRAIQPADADADEARLLIDELLAGATDEQALDHLAFVRAQRAQIERVVGQASPWEVVLVDMQSRIGRTECATWLRPARLEKIEDGRAVVAVPTAQAKAAIESRYLGMLGAALSEAVGRALQVRLVIQSSSSM